MNDVTKLGYVKDMTDEQKAELAAAMLDSSFEDIQDLPDFINLPKGTFEVSNITSADITFNDKQEPVIRVVTEIGETVELAQFPNTPVTELDPALLPIPGSLTSFRYQGALGIQKFKKAFGPIIQATNPTISVREFVETLGSGAITGITITTTLRASKDDMVLGADGVTMVPKMFQELVSANCV